MRSEHSGLHRSERAGEGAGWAGGPSAALVSTGPDTDLTTLEVFQRDRARVLRDSDQHQLGTS